MWERMQHDKLSHTKSHCDEKSHNTFSSPHLCRCAPVGTTSAINYRTATLHDSGHATPSKLLFCCCLCTCAWMLRSSAKQLSHFGENQLCTRALCDQFSRLPFEMRRACNPRLMNSPAVGVDLTHCVL